MTDQEPQLPKSQRRNEFAPDIALDIEKGCPSQTHFLKKFFQMIGLPLEQIRTALDLGCGLGHYTLPLLNLFPNSQVHAVDYHDCLLNAVKKHGNLIFHQGLIVDILAKKEVPLSDLILLFWGGDKHGFNEQNIHLLKGALRPNGYLVTLGDNNNLETTPFFKNNFEPICLYDGFDPTLGAIWQSKTST